MSSDGVIRAAQVKTQSKTGCPTVLRRLIQHLYPVRLSCKNKRQVTISQKTNRQEVKEHIESSYKCVLLNESSKPSSFSIISFLSFPLQANNHICKDMLSHLLPDHKRMQAYEQCNGWQQGKELYP